MIYVPHSIGLVIAACHKCASTSITNQYHVPGTKPISLEAVIELKKSFWKVVGVVRDPIDRFESAYNFFQYGQTGSFPTGKYTSIESFTDDVLSGVIDRHWAPQSDLLLECNSYVDLESFPLRLRQNSVNHREFATYRLNELKDFYSGDYRLRGNEWQL